MKEIKFEYKISFVIVLIVLCLFFAGFFALDNDDHTMHIDTDPYLKLYRKVSLGLYNTAVETGCDTKIKGDFKNEVINEKEIRIKYKYVIECPNNKRHMIANGKYDAKSKVYSVWYQEENTSFKIKDTEVK